MDILTPIERQKIDGIIDDVADTYFKTPISITRTGVGGVLPDRWNNGTTAKSGASQALSYNLLCMIEYVGPTTSFFMDNIGGADSDFDVLMSTTVKRGIDIGIITSDRKCILTSGDTVVVANNKEKYRIVAILFDGHFESSGQLLMFKCKRETLI